jgi:hypothetical protein
MDVQIEDKIDEMLELTRENNKILRNMHRRFVWGQVFTFIYWLIILGVVGWSYVYFQPYLSKYMNAYDSIMSAMNSNELQGILGTFEKARQ